MPNTHLYHSFAKLNLSLYVYRPRKKDGYHPICSVFQTISLKDTLTITPQPQHVPFTLTCSDASIPTGQSNLITRAYLALAPKLRHSYAVHLDKQIPSGGGLGGGSSNAAAFLNFLNTHERLNIPYNTLVKIAKTLGADVPFFLTGGTALVRGIGDKVRPLPAKPTQYYVLINPNIHCDTQKIYAAYDANLPSHALKVGRTPNTVLKNHLGPNDFQSVVFNLIPELRKIDQFVTQHNGQLHLSGSGATTFLVAGSTIKARQWQTLLKEAFPNYFIKTAQSVNGEISDC